VEEGGYTARCLERIRA